jgi:hypothetical protein
MSASFRPSQWHLDIDAVVDPILPPNWLSRLPQPVAHFLGYRTHPPRKLGNVAIIFWAFLGAFCSIAAIEGVGAYVPEFVSHGAPTIIGSFV